MALQGVQGIVRELIGGAQGMTGKYRFSYTNMDFQSQWCYRLFSSLWTGVEKDLRITMFVLNPYFFFSI